MTEEAFAVGMAAMGTAFSREVDRETMSVYFEVLKPLSDRAWKVAVQRALEKCEFFPPPAKLLDFADRRDLTQVQATDRALEAMKPDPAKVPSLEELKALRSELGVSYGTTKRSAT